MKSLRRKLEEAGAQAVEVGIFDNPELAKRAMGNEFGAGNRPARPFMRVGLDGAKQELGDALEEASKKMLDGMHPKIALAKAGIKAVRVIVESIEDFDTPPNAPSTIRKKGFDDPLIEHGDMKRAVDWRISDENVETIKSLQRGDDG